MSQIYWIDGRLWLQWSAAERGEITADLEARGIAWGLNFIECRRDPQADFQKDKDEYREEMGLGGRPFDE